MNLLRAFAGLIFCAYLFTACHSSKKTTSTSSNSSKKAKNPIAAEAALKIGNMLDKLATDLTTATNGGAEIIRTYEGVNITFQPDFYFESSSERLTMDAKLVLQDIAKVLNRYPYTEIFIEGHADSSGNQLNNKKLSQARAKNVALFMKSNGVVAERMAIAGYGATKPLVSNDTPEGRKKNRRVVVKIRANEEKFLTNEVAGK